MNFQSSKLFGKGVFVFLLVILLTFRGGVAFVRAAPGDRTRASVDSSGAQGNDMSRRGQISANGRFVVFESDATNLSGGTGGIFVKDRQTGATTRVSVDGEKPSISNDGRFVAFESFATNLISGDTNNVYDIFIFNSQTGLTTRVSVDSSGAEANDESKDAAISSDGRFVIFTSNATNLVSGDTNDVGDIFVHDLQTGVTERVSIATDGTQANNASSFASISADGRIVVFSSSATNLVSGDTNNKMDIFARDRQTNTTTRVSVNSSGVQADRGASDSSVSATGRYVSFSSTSENLVSQPPLEFEHVFVYDRQTGITTRASSYSDGNQMIGDSEESVISADGRYIAFVFDDKGDSQPFLHIYVHDSLTGATISAPSNRQVSDFSPSISADGSFLVYSTPASLLPGDTNGVDDVYVYEVSFIPNLTPTVTSIQPLCGEGCSPSAPAISLNVTFSEAVTGVTADDFALSITGGISGASITDVSGSGNTYIVNINTGTGDGTLRLDVIDNDSIQDVTLISLGGAGVGNGNFNTGPMYIIDKTSPQTTSILLSDPNYSSADIVHFSLTFSEAVSGVDASDFVIATTGVISSVAITDVSGAANTYSVTMSTGTGDGTFRIDLIDNDSIVDTAGNPLGGVSPGNGNFSLGETYAIDKNAPIIISSVRLDANPTAAATVRFNVTFSEATTGVDVSDFALATTNISAASIVGVERGVSGFIYIVTVSTGSGNGTLRLDLIDNDSIVDDVNHPLGGLGFGNGNFTAGEVYTVNKFTLTFVTTTFKSNGSSDGWVLESNEDSNLGGSKNSNASIFKLGDDSQDRQFRSVLHFPTYYLPDNAVVTQVILMIKKQDAIGTDPFTTHQNIAIDIRKGYFSNFNIFSFGSLQLTDFQAPADVYSVGVIQNNPVSGWYWAMLDSRAFPYINLTDITQFRLGFQVDDNDDLGEDYIRFYSGDYAEQRDRPHLQIEYYVPR